MDKPIKLKIKPTIQDDGHSCGYCAAASIYRYYGLDPEELQLREYLGTDHALPYNFPARERIEAWLGGSDFMGSGTLPMDMLANLFWDGFDTTPLPGSYQTRLDRLADHLEGGEPALALAYSCWHWVVVSGISSRGVRITNGLHWDRHARRTYTTPHDEFERDCHGLILVSLAEEEGRDMTYFDYAREYSRGIAFSAAMLGSKIPTGIRRKMAGE
jgi:hypothetical protein